MVRFSFSGCADLASPVMALILCSGDEASGQEAEAEGNAGECEKAEPPIDEAVGHGLQEERCDQRHGTSADDRGIEGYALPREYQRGQQEQRAQSERAPQDETPTGGAQRGGTMLGGEMAGDRQP